ncbi:MAG: hypothetical protein F8N36_08540 [Desulfovibrio sp.]|uniref:hypothetical protein n=1 Tax=Desulfovibrio sp. TaxID=885 RepID=UPI00135ED9D1|nr:hypothetical protein [Desulfovibrio sp.]MTJ92892.1 hypothetical protein [Desulfovibrio sp.]
MAITQDFIYGFGGFGGYPSRCLIRILDEADKPLVVICSQMANKPGTSVTNAAEIISKSIQEYLAQDSLPLCAAIQRYIKTSKLTTILDDLITRLKESKTHTIFTLESIKLALEYRESQIARLRKVKELIWVEHYNASLGLNLGYEYMEVSFVPGTWGPKWTGTTISALSESTGYPIAEFQIDPSAVHLP